MNFRGSFTAIVLWGLSIATMSSQTASSGGVSTPSVPNDSSAISAQRWKPVSQGFSETSNTHCEQLLSEYHQTNSNDSRWVKLSPLLNLAGHISDMKSVETISIDVDNDRQEDQIIRYEIGGDKKPTRFQYLRLIDRNFLSNLEKGNVSERELLQASETLVPIEYVVRTRATYELLHPDIAVPFKYEGRTYVGIQELSTSNLRNGASVTSPYLVISEYKSGKIKFFNDDYRARRKKSLSERMAVQSLTFKTSCVFERSIIKKSAKEIK